jgi:predicted nucleic acid-binding protein
VNLVFYDTWAYRALANRRDPEHERARRVDERLAREGTVRVTTNYVLDESLTGILRDAGGQVAEAFGRGMYVSILSGLVRYERIGPDREARAFELFARRRDVPRLSFTDCTSFVVMRALGIRDVLTGDAHFEQVGLGFRRLPE